MFQRSVLLPTMQAPGITSSKPVASEVQNFFARNGYHLAKNVFSASEAAGLEEDFGRIAAQLQSSREDVNAQ